MNALADFVLEKIVAESMPDSASRRETPQAAEETASAPHASMSDTSEATTPEMAGGAPPIISFGGDEEEPAGESVEKCNDEMSTAGAEGYDEDVYDDCRPSLWDRMQQRPLLTGLLCRSAVASGDCRRNIVATEPAGNNVRRCMELLFFISSYRNVDRYT